MHVFRLIFRFVIQIIWLPIDVFRFTYHCWLYTFSMIRFRAYLKYSEDPCIFCRGESVGHTRYLNRKIKYQNIWMVKLLNPEIDVTSRKGRIRPALSCKHEGGYRNSPMWIPWAAVILGAAWFCVLGAGLWYSDILPDAFQNEVEATTIFWE